MRYKGIIEDKRKYNDELIAEVMNQHANCCERCKSTILWQLNFVSNIGIKNLKSSLNRREREYKRFRLKNCEKCGIDYNLHIHHIDGDRRNNRHYNLQTLCGNCHCKEHMKK